MNSLFLRTGIGYDIHPFDETRPLFLGGVEIEHPRGLAGHSDADVLCHAMADALLGAAGEKDIGFHFPNTEERWRGISGLDLLLEVGRILSRKGALIVNIDSTVIAEAPKISPHVETMRERIAMTRRLDTDRVGIKATTNERMGPIGRGEGIAAFATALVYVTPATSDSSPFPGTRLA